jgi:hypothetical protein
MSSLGILFWGDWNWSLNSGALLARQVPLEPRPLGQKHFSFSVVHPFKLFFVENLVLFTTTTGSITPHLKLLNIPCSLPAQDPLQVSRKREAGEGNGVFQGP